MDKATQRAAERAANKLLKAAGYDPSGKSLRQVLAKRRKAAHEARCGKKGGKIRGGLTR